MTGGQAPIRAISCSSAAISPGCVASMSITTTVASSRSRLPSIASSLPETRRSPIWSLAPKVWRTCCSKPSSAVSTTTWVFGAWLLDRPMRMGFKLTFSLAVRRSLDCRGGNRGLRRGTLARRAVVRLRALLLRLRERAGGAAGRGYHVALPVALDGDLHALTVEGQILVADIARPRIDHLRHPIGVDVVVGAQCNRVAAIEVEIGAPAEQGAKSDRREQRFATCFSS